jgi:hypothetical protein
MRMLAPSLIAAMLVASPAVAQDFLQDFESFVEDMLPQRGPARPAPTGPVPPSAPEVARPVPPSLPTPVGQRPDAGEDAAATAEESPEGPGAAEDATNSVSAPVDVAEPEPEAPAAPERIYQTACPALLSGTVVGEMLEPIAEGICGERSPLSVTAVRVNGHEIGLSSPVTTNCEMAGALADWVGEVDAYASAAMDSSIATLTTGTSMMCRNRYSAADGFVSEHGFANAVDVVGFTLEDGQTIAVEADWLPAASPAGKLLRQAHGSACGRFTTVLGPEANEDHKDHFHLDLGCHGQTCTAQICE